MPASYLWSNTRKCLGHADNVRPSKNVKRLEGENIFVFWQSYKLGFYMMGRK